MFMSGMTSRVTMFGLFFMLVLPNVSFVGLFLCDVSVHSQFHPICIGMQCLVIQKLCLLQMENSIL